jgi:hypothetical protein
MVGRPTILTVQALVMMVPPMVVMTVPAMVAVMVCDDDGRRRHWRRRDIGRLRRWRGRRRRRL